MYALRINNNTLVVASYVAQKGDILENYLTAVREVLRFVYMHARVVFANQNGAQQLTNYYLLVFVSPVVRQIFQIRFSLVLATD